MTDLLRTRNTAVWVTLVAVTVLSWAMGTGMGITDPEVAAVAILLITLGKVRFVILEFMEVRTAPVWLGRAADGWLIVIGALLIGRFLIS